MNKHSKMKTTTKQTAVAWLVDKLEIFATEEEMNIIDQAKEMEKEQIVNSFMEGADFGEMFNNEGRGFITDAEQYYNRTFKSE